MNLYTMHHLTESGKIYRYMPFSSLEIDGSLMEQD